jgi:hypothetical protein
MNDLPSTILLQQLIARPKGGEDLEVFGKEASSRYLSGRSPTLTEAVVDTVKSAGLSPEQVKRVVEFANTDAFLQEFKKEGRVHKVVEFDGGPANYSDVLKDLNDGGGGSALDSGSGDYDTPPPNVAKTASANADRLGLEHVKLAQAFAVEEQSIPYENPMQDSIEMREKLAAAYDGVSSSLSSLEVHYTDVLDHLAHEVKQAALGGTSLGEIVTAWSVVSDEPTFMKAAFEQLTPRLLDGGVFPSRGAIGESLTKTASFISGMVNTEHPLIRHYGEFCETLTKLARTRAVQQEIYEGLNNITTFIQKLAAGPSKGLVGAAWKNLNVAAEHAGRGGEVVGDILFGKGTNAAKMTGKVTKGAVKWGVPALAAEEAHEYGTQSPKARRVTYAVASHLPTYMSESARYRRAKIQRGL